jgi:hypothetical protein
MPALEKIGFFLDERDEKANTELARELAETDDIAGIAEIARNLWNKKEAIRADCIKVLYEVGFLKPELIAHYTQDFLKLLVSRNNRLVWGAMYALACISSIQADELFGHVHEIEKAMNTGSVITVDNGVKTLAGIAAARTEYQAEILPYLLEHLAKCRLKEVPQHAESTYMAVSGDYIKPYRDILEKRLPEMTPPQAARVKKLLKRLDLL